MNIQKTDENCFLVELSKDDMNSFGITYEHLSTASEHARQALKNIIKSASKKQSDFPTSFSNMKIDLMPGIPDGCVIIFTHFEEKNTLYEIFESNSLDAFLDSAKAISPLGSTKESSLYTDGKVFRLTVSSENSAAINILSEFSERLDCDGFETERTKEYMKCLIFEKALEILCGKGTHL